MSHVIVVDLQITCLATLAAAAKACGLEFVEGQKTFRWFGTHVGDYPLPKGFGREDMGRCEHALRVVGSDVAYEVGVVTRRDGKPGYALLFDFYAGGHGLMERLGEKANRLSNHYIAQVAKQEMEREGFHVELRENEQQTEVDVLCLR